MSEPLISKEVLLKSGLPEETVAVENLGAVRVRSLSRAEFIALRMSDGAAWEVGVVAAGLVEPALTLEEAAEWHKQVAPRVFDDLAAEILRVSGLRVSAVEEAKRSFPEG